MTKIARWNTVSRENWSFRFVDVPITTRTFALTSLPDFSEPRFVSLSEKPDSRVAKVIERQRQMLRQLHGLGPEWGLSLRIVKDEELTLYLVFRNAQSLANKSVLQSAEEFIRSSLANRAYSFEPVKDERAAFDLSWASEGADIYKQEEERHGDAYPAELGIEPQHFYVPVSWVGANNDMQHICKALMQHKGRACVEVTLVPTKYLDDEFEWMGNNIQRMREAMNGETIRGANRRVLWQGQKLPALKPVVDNCDKINTQYATSAVFLSCIHVFAEQNAKLLANALLANSSSNMGASFVISRRDPAFACLERSYTAVDVCVDIPSQYWLRHLKDPQAPFRAQRLQRIVSVEEASNFFRLPIPLRPGFPGFGLDTGLDTGSLAARERRKGAQSAMRLNVGRYLDGEGTQDEANFEVQQFAKHGLVVGVPGSGKTTALFSILHQLWDAPEEQRIPFIVLEPAKTEYRALKKLPVFEKDMLVFTLGDEDASPFRFNPLEVLPGIRLENHISKLQACFVGAFDLFDPLPIFLEQAIRRTYLEAGWFDDSRGGEPGLITPTLADLCRNAEHIVEHSGFDDKLKSDFKASLLERLNSLRRGSKGRMLDCKHSIPMEDLMAKPVILELDSLNGDEKSLLMMFLLSYVFEYCKVMRKSGSPLRHLLVVEEAHNLISASGNSNENRANPRAQTIELFVNMLAEMRALGQGILIADQLPTAIAPQAVKQTNVKVLMRVTAKDDREEIGNTMDLNEEQMHQVVNFKTGHAYLYHEGEDRVRMIRMPNFKGDHNVEEPPDDAELSDLMQKYELAHRALYLPFEGCASCCTTCDRRTRNQAESFVTRTIAPSAADVYEKVFASKDAVQFKKLKESVKFCGVCLLVAKKEVQRIKERYGGVNPCLGQCMYLHIQELAQDKMSVCAAGPGKSCGCDTAAREDYLSRFAELTKGEA